jgi:hypothetical protein
LTNCTGITGKPITIYCGNGGDTVGGASLPVEDRMSSTPGPASTRCLAAPATTSSMPEAGRQ